jgi:hypothetical protein
MTRLAFAAALALSLAGLSGAARADLAPPNACSGPGTACNTAGPNYNAAGTCATKTCTRTLPPTMAGGPPTTTSYSCNLCEAKATDAGADSGQGSKSSDDGCSYGGRGGGSIAALAAVALVLGARRRRG